MKKSVLFLMGALLITSLCAFPSYAAETENVALNATYTINGIYTDGDGVSHYIDEDGKSLNNGVFAQTAGYDQTEFIGLNATSEWAKANDGTTSVVFDLGQAYPIVNTAVSCSNLGSAGISAPESVLVTYSTDGENWSEPVYSEYEFDLVQGEVIKSIAKLNAEARYITFTFYHANNWVFVDEIEVYAGDINAKEENNSENSSENSSTVNTPEKKAEINSDIIYISAAAISVVILIVVVVFSVKKKK